MITEVNMHIVPLVAYQQGLTIPTLGSVMASCRSWYIDGFQLLKYCKVAVDLNKATSSSALM